LREKALRWRGVYKEQRDKCQRGEHNAMNISSHLLCSPDGIVAQQLKSRNRLDSDMSKGKSVPEKELTFARRKNSGY
jgi:hypothetical protein